METPFNNWAKALKDVNPEAAQSFLFNPAEFEFSGFDGASYARESGITRRVALPSSFGMQGIIRSGSSIYSMPGGVLQGGKVLSTVDAFYSEMNKAAADPDAYITRAIQNNPDIDFGQTIRVGGAYGKMDAIKVASKVLLESSKSSLVTQLGPDHTISFSRGMMIDINELQITAGKGKQRATLTLGKHLSNLNKLQSEYARSDGIDLVAKQDAIKDYYQQIVSAVEGAQLPDGRRVFISGIKDKLFREHGVASLLSASDISFHATKKMMGKGLHQYAKLLPISRKAVQVFGLSLPATSGQAFADELSYVNKLNRMSGGAPGGVTTRFAADTFVAFGQRVGNTLKPSRILGDSRSIAGEDISGLTRYTHGRRAGSLAQVGYGIKSKSVIVAGAESNEDLLFHKSITNDVNKILRGEVPEGMFRNEFGEYKYRQPKNINLEQTKLTDGTKINGILGFSVPQVQGQGNIDDVKMSAVSVGGRRATTDIYGFKLTGKAGGAVQIFYGDRKRDITERAMVIGGTRFMQQGAGARLETTTGRKVHQIVPGANIGIDKNISNEFLSRYMAHIAHSSKEQGKLAQFAKFVNTKGGGDLGVRTFNDNQYIYHKSTRGANNLFANIHSVLRASDAQLEAMGVTKEARDILKLGPQGIHLNQAAIQTVKYGGEVLEGILLKGMETAYRTGTASDMNIGPGAMSMRMHDMMPMIRQQMAAYAPNSALGRAYRGFHDAIKKEILVGRRGRLGSPERALSGAAVELANIAEAIGRKPGHLIKGIKSNAPQMALHRWVNEGAEALARTEQGAIDILKDGAMTQGMLTDKLGGRNHVHATGYSGEVIKLPRAINFVVNPHTGEQMSTKAIPLVSDRFLGATPHEAGKYLTSGGIRNLGLPRKKALLAALMKEHGQDFHAGKKTAGTKSLTEAASSYMNALMMAMPGKQGLLYHNLKGQPSGAFYGEVINLGSVGRKGSANALTLGMNPNDARELLRSAGFERSADKILENIKSGKKDFFLNTARYPWHQGSNLGVMKLMIDENIAEGKTAVSDIFMRVAKGDFDKDNIAGFITRGQQHNLEKIYNQRLRIMVGYDQMVRRQEDMMLAKIATKIQTGMLATGDDLEKIADKGDLVKALANRMGSAAGGGAFVGPVHMGWARMTALTHSLYENQSNQWIKTIAVDAPDLARQLKALRADQPFQTMAGVLQETGVYGILKKGAAGFGKDEISALSALRDYGSGKMGIDEVKSVFTSGFRQAQESGELQASEVLDKFAKHGITSLDDKRIPQMLTDEIFGAGTGHEGIGSIAKMRNLMKAHGIADPDYEAARGKLTSESAIRYYGTRMDSAMDALFGQADKPATQGADYAANAASDNLRRILAEDSAEVGRTVFEKGAEAVDEGIVGGFRDSYNSLKDAFNTKWGKRAAIGAGIVLGIGALDSIFGSDGDNSPQAPMFNGGGAPLPPSAPISFADQGIDMPTAESFGSKASAPARIERPYAQRQQYMIQGTAGNQADFSYLEYGHLGTLGGPPVSEGHIRDGSMANSDINYMIRSNLRSSF